MILTVPFLTDLDPQAAIKGSRDPLGLQTMWARLGRHVVGNLTTVSTSVRDFTTLVLGYYFAERIANEAGGDGDLAAFLRWEQLAAYARGEINGDWAFRGVERVKRNLQDGGRIRLGIDSTAQILSNQKTYGLWGLYTVPGRSSGLVEGDPTRLTAAGRDLVDRVYLPIFAQGGLRHADAVVARLTKARCDLDPHGGDRRFLQAVAKVLDKRVMASEREVYSRHLLLGGPEDRTAGGRAILAAALESTLADQDWTLSRARVRHLAALRGVDPRCLTSGSSAPDRADLIHRFVRVVGVVGRCFVCDVPPAEAERARSGDISRVLPGASMWARVTRVGWGAARVPPAPIMEGTAASGTRGARAVNCWQSIHL